MKNMFSRKISIIGVVVGALLISSAIGAVASSRHGDRHLRIELASTPAMQHSERLESPVTAPTARPEAPENEAAEAAEDEPAENEAAENEPAENEPADKEPAENEQPAPAPPAPASTPASSMRTFSLVGGTVAVTCNGNVISITSATPNAGFTTESEQNDGGQAEVRFRSDSHESRLEVSCQNGTIVVQELREEES
jgi:uncharacterized membrane protein